MRTIVFALTAIVVVGTAASAWAQRVVTYYPAAAPVATYYAPSVPVATYAPATTYVTPAPVTTYYAPVVTPRYYAPRVIVRPKVYVRGQPIRNVLRAITP